MAITSRKSSKNRIGQQSKALPKSTPKSNKDSGTTSLAEQARRASILLKHISDTTRFQLIQLLTNDEYDVGTICVRLGMDRSVVSHHLALLRHGRIISSRRKGAKNYYDLTERGRALAEVAESLLNENTPVHRVGFSESAPRKTADSPGTSNSEPASHESQSTEEVHRGPMNRRRIDLIFKKNRGGLNDMERSELEHLQALSLAQMQREFPAPPLIGERLKKIEERLRSDRTTKK